VQVYALTCATGANSRVGLGIGEHQVDKALFTIFKMESKVEPWDPYWFTIVWEQHLLENNTYVHSVRETHNKKRVLCP
jgi:hypothetical protein